mgnify:CR=1 FL=1
MVDEIDHGKVLLEHWFETNDRDYVTKRENASVTSNQTKNGVLRGGESVCPVAGPRTRPRGRSLH